jgi:hypothetical protein
MDYYCCKCGREVDLEKPCVVDGEQDIVAHLICGYERKYCSLCGRPLQEIIARRAGSDALICEGHDGNDVNDVNSQP